MSYEISVELPYFEVKRLGIGTRLGRIEEVRPADGPQLIARLEKFSHLPTITGDPKAVPPRGNDRFAA
jgi:hypothetical protein